MKTFTCECCKLQCLNIYLEPKCFDGVIKSMVLCQVCIRHLWEKGKLPPVVELPPKKKRRKKK